MSAPNSRARPTEVAGLAAVVAFVVFGVLVGLDARTDGRRVVDGAPASEALLEAWERHRTATYAATTRFTRTGPSAELVFDGRRVQRPPDELVVSLSESELRLDDQIHRCLGDADRTTVGDIRCVGPSPGVPHDERVLTELQALAGWVHADDALYTVRRVADVAPPTWPDADCFELALARAYPIPPYGRSARFCFDDATGALVDTEVVYDGGIVETTRVVELNPVVTDDDLRLVSPED